MGRVMSGRIPVSSSPCCVSGQGLVPRPGQL